MQCSQTRCQAGSCCIYFSRKNKFKLTLPHERQTDTLPTSKQRSVFKAQGNHVDRSFWIWPNLLAQIKKKKKKISRERVWPKAFHISLLLTYGSMFFILKSSSQNKGHMLSVFYSRRYDWKLHMQVLGHGLKVEKNTCPPPATFLHLTAGYMRWKELKQPT